ncbi:MAG: MOSC domain-containing protein [Anaerolineae bacterium]|nr:MOSC domain-containing protein [Anaerolineae bacterium]
MQLLSVNVGTVQPIQNAKPSGKTGIFKTPRTEPIKITELGLEGDAIIDTQNHGGVDQAVYVFTAPDYAWWSSYLGRALEPGMFGENFTISGLESASLHIGDRLQVGAVLIEVTSPRIPCVTIAARMGDPQFVKKFQKAERPGVYCRVIEVGSVRARDPVTLIPYQGEQVGILELFRVFYSKRYTEDLLRRFLSVPIHTKDKPSYEKKLARLLARSEAKPNAPK